jgi:hypothetical protein
VEYVLGAVQAVYRRYGEGEADYRPLPHQALVGRLARMGQQLFAPPNVKGWRGGPSWLNTSTLLERDNFAGALAMGTWWADPVVGPTAAAAVPLLLAEAGSRPARPAAPADAPAEREPPRALDPARLLEEERVSRPEDVVRVLLDLYLPGGVRPEARAKLVAFVALDKPAGPAMARRVREAVHAILTMPEYHVA